MLDDKIYQSVFNCSLVGEYLLAPTAEATILAVNETFLRIVSRKREELVGKGLFDAFPGNPDDPGDTGVTALHQSLIRVIATSQPDVMPLQRYPIVVRLPDGRESYEDRYWSVSNTPIFDEEGRLVCISHRTVDVTERKHADDAAQQQAARQAFQLALADRIRPLTDPEEVTAVASELLGKQLGAKRVIYGGMDKSGERITVNRDWTDGTLPSMAGVHLTLNDFGPLVAGVLREGRVLALDDVTTHEQSAPYAEAYFALGVRSVLAIPLMKAGQLRAILSIHDSCARHWSDDDIAMAEDMEDRTWLAVESARAQAELRTERDQSQHIFDSMTEGFGLLDDDWTILRVNETGAKTTRRDRSELLGKNHWEAVPELAGTDVEALYRRVKATGITETLEVYHTFPSGITDWIEVRAYPLTAGRLAVFFRNITERKFAEQQLKDADRRKDEFLAMLAHELRNPLAPIGAAADFLRLAPYDEARVKKTTEIIARQVEHMTGLVDDLLDVSRVTRGLVTLQMLKLDAKPLVLEAVEQVRPLIQARSHYLAVHLPEDSPIIQGDKKRLVQVIANLLTNAAKYTPEGGNIVLTMNVDGEHLNLSVSDDGIGMEPELIGQAFNLFVQAERAPHRSQGGLGIGLALVKSLVELHNGQVSAFSKGNGKGTRFTVTLPTVNECSADLSDSKKEPASSSPANQLKILVVDDNIDGAQMLAMLCEALGHEVVVEYTALRALELARNLTPDVCLLDIGLPDIDGYELASRLRAQSETANTILAAVTGYGQAQDRGHAFAAGFDHHFVKPISITRLADLLKGVSESNNHP